jgi:hypothetical protein
MQSQPTLCGSTPLAIDCSILSVGFGPNACVRRSPVSIGIIAPDQFFLERRLELGYLLRGFRCRKAIQLL